MRHLRPSRRARRRVPLAGVAAAALAMAAPACGGNGLSVADSQDITVPASDDETDETDETDGTDDTATLDDTDSTTADEPPADTRPPTFTFPKPTAPASDAELPVITDAVVTTAPATVPATSPSTTPPLAPASAPVTAPGAAYTFVEVFDDTGLISASVPTAWTDVDGTSMVFGEDGESTPLLEVSPDLDRYRTHWDTPGMRFSASPYLAGLDPEDMIDVRRPSDCDTAGPQPYDDGAFVGAMEVFTNCGGTGASLYVIGATNNAGDVGVIVSVQTVTAADTAAFEEIQRTFNIHS